MVIRFQHDQSVVPMTEIGRRSVLAGAMGVGLVGLVASPTRATTTVRASDFGFDPVDATGALQAALDSTADTVIIDNVGAEWITRPLFLNRSDVTIIVEPGVILRAKAGGFPNTSDCLLKIDDCANVAIVGYGAAFIMNKPEYTTGEWRMCLSLLSVSGVVVEGLALRDSGGDGVYLGVSGTNTSAPRYCHDVTLRNVICDNNRRNGITVISADGLTIEGCAITRTNGTPPRAGIDFEPNNAGQRLSNIIVRDTVFTENHTVQVLFNTTHFDATSLPISVVLERVYLDKQGGGSPVLSVTGSGDIDPGGTIEVRDSVLATDLGSSNVGVYWHSAAGAHITFRRCVLWNWDNNVGANRPVMVVAGRGGLTSAITSYGGVTFTDCLLITDQPAPQFKAIEAVGGELTNVHGTLAVFGQASPVGDYGTAPVNTTVSLAGYAASPHSGPMGASVSVMSDTTVITPGSPVTLAFTRVGGVLSEPLAARFSMGGTAVERVDLDGTAGVVVFPPGQATVTVVVGTLASPNGNTVTIAPTIEAHVSYVN